MALTVSQAPALYTPAYNTQVFRALSNQFAVADFKYIVTVQINGGTIFTYNILQRPDHYLIFDPIEIVKNYIKHTIVPTSIAPLQAADNAVTVEVKIKEYYTSAIQSTYTYNYTAWNACLSDEVFKSYVYTDYVSNAGVIKLLSPNSGDCLLPDSTVSMYSDLWLYFFRNNCTSIVASLYSPLSVLIGTVTKAIPTTNNLIYYCNLGVNFFDGSLYTPYEGCTVEFDIYNGVTSNYFNSYTISNPCTNYTEYNVYYLKNNGSFGFKRFELLSQENETKKVNTVRLNPKTNGTNSYGANPYDREVNVVSTVTTKTISLNSNWITEAQSTALEELFSSPLVWIQKLGGDYIPVRITDTSYAFKKHINEPLFNYTIQCEYDIQGNRQRAI